MDASNPWIDWLHDLICEMYEAWGGDCSDLGLNVTQWIDTIDVEYSTHGPPHFETEAEKEDFLETLDETESHLEKPQNSLSESDDRRLRTLIANLRHDIGSTSELPEGTSNHG